MPTSTAGRLNRGGRWALGAGHSREKEGGRWALGAGHSREKEGGRWALGAGHSREKEGGHQRCRPRPKPRTRADAESGNKNRSQAGFTLIELAMVVLLLGLFAGLTMPMLLNFGQDDLRASARRLSGTVKYLYNEAALTGLEHRLVFNLAEGNYRGQVVNRNGELKPLTGTGRGHSLAGLARFRDIYQPRNGTLSSGEVTTALLPGGWLEETVIHLALPNGENLTLRLMPLTGTTEIFDGYRDFENQP